MHIENHPYFGRKLQEPVTIFFNDRPLKAYPQQTITGALIGNGIKIFGNSRKYKQTRGYFCSRGRCCSCYMTVDGEDHVRTCLVRVKEGMKIYPNEDDPELRRSYGN